MPLKIVYLDDEPDLCSIFEEMFTSPEVEIKTFVDPALAIQHIRSYPPDLIFLDYRLPNTTGERIAIQLNNKIPTVLVTGDMSSQTQFPFQTILQKPYRQEDGDRIIAAAKKGKEQ